MTELLYKCSDIMPKEFSNEILPTNDFQPTTLAPQVFNVFVSTENLSEHKESTNGAQENIKATTKEDFTMNQEVDLKTNITTLNEQEEGKTTMEGPATGLYIQCQFKKVFSIHFTPTIEFVIPEKFDATIQKINIQIFSIFSQFKKRRRRPLKASQRQLHMQIQSFWTFIRRYFKT